MSCAPDAKPRSPEGQNPVLGLSPDGGCVLWDQDAFKAKPTAFVFSPTAPQLTVRGSKLVPAAGLEGHTVRGVSTVCIQYKLATSRLKTRVLPY